MKINEKISCEPLGLVDRQTASGHIGKSSPFPSRALINNTKHSTQLVAELNLPISAPLTFASRSISFLSFRSRIVITVSRVSVDFKPSFSDGDNRQINPFLWQSVDN